MPVSRLTYSGTCEDLYGVCLLNLDCESMGPDRLQPGALGELAAALAELLSISFEKLW